MTETNARDDEPESDEYGEQFRASGPHETTRYDGPTGRFRRAVGSHPILAFFAITFAYSWGVFALLYGLVGPEALAASRYGQIPTAWGPPIATVAVVWLAGGSVRDWLWSILDPRTNPAWYVLGIAVAFLLADTRSVLALLAGVPLELAQPPAEIARSFLLTLFLAGSLEEFGWRGFAQPHLQERYDALVGAVVIGVAFGLWHAPWVLLGGAGYEDGGPGALVALTIFGVLVAVLFAWLFNGSGGALPVVLLAHATVNAGTVFAPAGPTPGWLPETQPGLLVWIGLAVLLVAVYGRAYLAPRGPALDPLTRP